MVSPKKLWIHHCTDIIKNLSNLALKNVEYAKRTELTYYGTAV